MRRSVLATVLSVALCSWAATLLAAGCGPPDESCAADECLGTDGVCYGPCPGGTYCTTNPSGQCGKPSAGGVSCCVGGGSSGNGATSGGCTSNVCCGGLFECNGYCYATCTPGSQPCCTSTNCTCFTPCC